MDSTLASPVQSRSATQPRARALSNLLFVVAALVFAMVVVGGITRLTESGLSITEWKPISGAIPPLTHADWQHAFDLYQQTPQYRQVAGPAGMTLAGFKFIFFWEWVHRLLGRILGLVFFVGVCWFAARREIPKGYGWRLVGLFVLGGLQGAVGWFMVMSGLEGRTEVSPYRLAAHLLFALFLMGALIWTAVYPDMLERTGELRKKLRDNAAHFRSALERLGFTLVPGSHPIIPVMLGDARLASSMADKLLEEGIYVIGFSFPVVPKDKARIRTQISAAHEREHLDRAIAAFAKVGRELGVIR